MNKRRKTPFLLAAAISVVPAFASAQQFEVGAYIVVDTYSKKILSAKNVDAKRQVASLTKIATSKGHLMAGFLGIEDIFPRRFRLQTRLPMDRE